MRLSGDRLRVNPFFLRDAKGINPIDSTRAACDAVVASAGTSWGVVVSSMKSSDSILGSFRGSYLTRYIKRHSTHIPHPTFILVEPGMRKVLVVGSHMLMHAGIIGISCT
jgi:hypothetical protein